MERLLVTGIDLPVGANLALALADHHEILGIEQRGAVELAGVRTAACDLGDSRTIAELCRDWRPRWMIHCGPLAAPSWDDSPAASIAEREVRIAADLAGLAADLGVRLAVISSDAVFSGPRMFHTEDSPVATGQRATQIRNLERALEKSEALVLRTHAFGWNGAETSQCFAERVFAALSQGASLPLDGRRHATPILATDLALLVARALELRLTGLYHLSGAERTTPYHFACELAAACDLPAPVVGSSVAATEAAAADTSLNSRRARRMLEMPSPLVREGLERFARQRQEGWCERWLSAAARLPLREYAA